MRSIGTTERRVILALLLTALLPLMAAMGLASAMVQQVSSAAFQPEFREQLERSLALYRDLARSMRQGMASETTAIARTPGLQEAAGAGDAEALGVLLTEAIGGHPTLVSLSVERADGSSIASSARGRPIDEQRERAHEVRQALAGAAGPELVAVFGADRQRFDEVAAAQRFASAYQVLERSYTDAVRDRPYISIFAALVGLTVVVAVIVGALVVRPVTRSIAALVSASRPLADGDLSVRFDVHGPGEMAELAGAFNRMLEQLERSRARIEFLKRIGQWQTVARRLAHEIKNPLTPIQLAVEECCQRYRGDDEGFRALLATTRDIVIEEVASLRRLVGEFAAFARLPRANLRRGDLGEFVRDQWPRVERDELPDVVGRPVRLELAATSEPMPVALDRTMLHRVLVNLVANAAQASAEHSREGEGRVRVSCRRDGDHCVLAVEDDGPGIPDVLQPVVLDPYVTTKKNGTGLGLSIVNKIAIDHGGVVEVGDSPLGGALFTVRLPCAGTVESEAALSRSHAAAWSGSGAGPPNRAPLA